MPKQLLVIAGPDKGRTFSLEGIELLLVGRSKATETRLTDPHVSRVHCQVMVQGDDVTLLDHESASGTFVVRMGVSGDRCNGMTVVATGSKGSRAAFNFSEVVCAAPGAGS